MSNHQIVQTIFLLFAVVFGFVLNCLAVFLKQWVTAVFSNSNCMYQRDSLDGTPQSRGHLQGIGLVPFQFSCEPPYFRACSVMMIIAFMLYIMLVGFFVFALVSSMLQKYKLTRIGYLLVAILSFSTAALQIASFITTLACQQMYDNTFTYFKNPSVGASCYLALASGIFGFATLALSCLLYRGFKKESKAGEWSDGAQ